MIVYLLMMACVSLCALICFVGNVRVLDFKKYYKKIPPQRLDHLLKWKMNINDSC